MSGFEFDFVLVLVVVYGTSYGLRFLENYGIPVVAIEILAGVVFGSVLHVVGPASPGYDFLVTLAAFGLLLVMFEAGVELDPRLVRREPLRVGVLGGTTFLLPFLAGAGLALWLGVSPFAAFLVGVVTSTTSLGLVHPLLDDFDLLEYESGQLILSVTGLNDVLSIVALAYGIALSGGDPLVGAVVVTGVLVFLFVVVPVFLLERLSRFARSRLADDPVKTSVVLTAVLALFTDYLGIHAVLGGFFAGLLVGEVTRDGPDVAGEVGPIVTFVASVFFFYVGMNFDVSVLASTGAVLVLLVVAVGIGSKVVSALVGGFAVGVGRRTTLLLASTIPGRLSISVTAAEIGRSRGLISAELYDAFIVLSTLSVFATAAAFQYVMRSGQAVEEGPGAEPAGKEPVDHGR